MPRPPSDLQQFQVRLSPTDLARLDRIAKTLGLVNQAGTSVGTPNRSEAIRQAIHALIEKLQRSPQPDVLTLGVVATRLGAKVWQVRRLYEKNLLPPAGRMGLYRVVHADDLPMIKSALQSAGYLPNGKPSGPE